MAQQRPMAGPIAVSSSRSQPTEMSFFDCLSEVRIARPMKSVAWNVLFRPHDQGDLTIGPLAIERFFTISFTVLSAGHDTELSFRSRPSMARGGQRLQENVHLSRGLIWASLCVKGRSMTLSVFGCLQKRFSESVNLLSVNTVC